MIPGIQQYLPGITEEQLIAAGNYVVYSTIPMTNIHLRSHRGEEISTNNDIQSIYILSFIALFLIVLASVNFMNLSTANSLKRAKEVGVRKAMGSKKGELIRQFMIESGVIKPDGKGSKAALVYGQMNEPPGARARVGLTGLTVAEYFRDKEGQDVLFFVWTR